MSITHEAAAPSPRRTALKQTTLMETIYREVRRRLQRDELRPDARILDYEIAEEFECTRMPARQALLRLVSEGYLVGTTRGFVVPVLSAADIHEIFEVRRMLEPNAAALALPALTPVQLKAMKREVERAARAYEKDDSESMIEANVHFRSIWLDAVSNRRLRETILRFADHARQVRLATVNSLTTKKVIVEDLHELMDAFAGGDAAQVKRGVARFIDHAEREYFADYAPTRADAPAA